MRIRTKRGMQKSKLKIKMRRGHKGRGKKPKKGNMERRRQGRGKEGGGREKGMKGEMGVKFENTHFINEMIREGEGQVLLISKCKQTKTSSSVLLIYLLLK